jgi:hypothetical protein
LQFDILGALHRFSHIHSEFCVLNSNFANKCNGFFSFEARVRPAINATPELFANSECRRTAKIKFTTVIELNPCNTTQHTQILRNFSRCTIARAASFHPWCSQCELRGAFCSSSPIDIGIALPLAQLTHFCALSVCSKPRFAPRRLEMKNGDAARRQF